ncbi:MAG: T9SS type A sorting domain-containing protein [Bacteroidetes bacterium SB0662_bin_6]|nr:T9SS type A sorting domain-containing protein [Bacteroidetes bacterium SB0662_bin_6]
MLTVLATSPAMRAHATEVEHRHDGNDERLASTLAVAVPGAPTNFTATASGTNTINLSWTAPTNNGGKAITGYRIEAFSMYESNLGTVSSDSEEGGDWRTLVKDTGDTNLSYSHTGLSPNTVVKYRVRAINDDGVSEPSNEDEARTGLLGGGTAPTITSVTVNDTEMEITFDQNLDANSMPGEVFFPVKVSGNGGDYRVQDVAIQGAKVTLTLAENNGINHGQTLHVRYYQPTYIEEDVFLPTSGGLKSPAGNPVEKTMWKSVTNNTPPRITLALNPVSINENGGTATLTATIPSAITEAKSLTLTLEPVAPAVDTSLTISGTTLNLAQNATTSTETLTITATDNAVKEGHKTVRIRVLRENYPINEVAAKPFTVDLTIIDDESPPPLPPTLSTPSTPLELTPEAPMYLRDTPGNEQVTLTWDPPFYDTGDITGYAYRYKESDQTFGFDAPATWNDIPGGASARSYTVTGLTNGLVYIFEVRAENPSGGGVSARTTVRLPRSESQSLMAGNPAPVNTENEELPTEAALLGNYPNPFNPQTTIDYALPQTGDVSLVVYDMLGREVDVLIDGPQTAGRHTVRFDANHLPNGAYIYCLVAGDKTITRTMVLVK